jgi:ribonuclease HI
MIKIYIKGNCNPNPGPGTHGFLATLNDQEIPDCKFKFICEEKTDNVRQEMLALIHAMEWAISLKSDHKFHFYTCNGFISNGYNDFLPIWEKKENPEVKNMHLWNRISELKKESNFKVFFKKKIEMPWMMHLDDFLKNN